MKGMFVVYINCPPDCGKTPKELVDLFRELNKDVIDELARTLDYRITIIPTVKEACRIEKIDMEYPYPRYAPKYHVDIAEMQKRRDQRIAERLKQKEPNE